MQRSQIGNQRIAGVDPMIITHEIIEGNTIVRLDERLDAASVRDHRDELVAAADNADKLLVLNMAGVDFIDSTGLGMIVSLVKRVRENKVDLAISNLSPQAQSLFELTRMTRIFSIYPDEVTALQSSK